MRRLLALIWYQFARWLDYHRLGALADSCYRIAGSKGGKLGARALMLVGERLLAKEDFQAALKAFQDSIHHNPDNADAWCGLGIAYLQCAQHDEARRCFDRVLELAPFHLQGLTKLGELHLSQQHPDLALGYFDRVLEQDPLCDEALESRIAALTACDKLTEAEHAARQAIARFPDKAGLQNKLGMVLVRSGQPPLGLRAFEKALEIQPDHLDAQLNRANLKGNRDVLMGLEDHIRKKIALEGESAFLLESLAMALQPKYQLTESEEICRKLVQQYPTRWQGWMTYGLCESARGNPEEAIRHFKKVIELLQQDTNVGSNILFESTYLADMTPEVLFRDHLEWAEHHETPLLEKPFAHPAGGEPEKRLKIGYVSSDLGNHPVGDLLRGVLLQHDHGKFEIHCFSTTDASDGITDILRANSDFWHEVPTVSEDKLAASIRAIGIDILVDLSGHTAWNRLGVFARKPAPIQATWLGYFHSTGLRSIDYFITDPYTTPPMSGQLFSELPMRLPHSRFCFTPRDLTPEVAKPPSERNGYITFGSFNRMSKLTDTVVDAWSTILANVPSAKMLVKDRSLNDVDTAGRLKKRFEDRGVTPERLILRTDSGYIEALEEYADVDIALDPFPFNGGMTTLLALWMGVPVVALAGSTVVSRQSASVLSNIGHEELIFPDVESYIAGAVALACDTQRVTHLRAAIRPTMSRSPLCDAEQFTSDLEMLYRRMWQAWCRGEKLGSEIVAGAPVARRISSKGVMTRKPVPSDKVVQTPMPTSAQMIGKPVPDAPLAWRTVLHVGCGQADIRSLPSHFQKHWKELRLDIDPDACPDIVGTALDMSTVSAASVDAVFSSHMLEHLYAHELVIALAEMKRVLKPDGILVVTVPDLQTVAQLIVEDRLLDTAYESPAGPIAAFDMVYGHRGFIGSGRVYMAHRGGFTLTTLIDAIKDAGFKAVTGKRRESAYDLWVLATPNPMTNAQLNQLSAEVLPDFK